MLIAFKQATLTTPYKFVNHYSKLIGLFFAFAAFVLNNYKNTCTLLFLNDIQDESFLHYDQRSFNKIIASNSLASVDKEGK